MFYILSYFHFIIITHQYVIIIIWDYHGYCYYLRLSRLLLLFEIITVIIIIWDYDGYYLFCTMRMILNSMNLFTCNAMMMCCVCICCVTFRTYNLKNSTLLPLSKTLPSILQFISLILFFFIIRNYFFSFFSAPGRFSFFCDGISEKIGKENLFWYGIYGPRSNSHKLS